MISSPVRFILIFCAKNSERMDNLDCWMQACNKVLITALLEIADTDLNFHLNIIINTAEFFITV